MRVASSAPGGKPVNSGTSRSGPELARRLRSRFFLAIAAANVLGAIDVFVFLSVVLPVPSRWQESGPGFEVNLLVFAAYMLVAVPVGIAWGRSTAAPILSWLAEDRRPTPEERQLTLEFPIRGFARMGPLWLGAALVFGVLNAFSSPALGVIVGLTIALGGMTTCTVVVLWAERLTRDVLSLALERGVPEEPVGPGVAARISLAWALASGIVLLGLVLLSAVVLLGADVSAERLALTALVLAAVGLSVGLLAVVLAGRSVADPLQEVRAALAEVEGGNLDAAVRVSDGSEVGLVAAGFNRMAAGLREREQLRDLFGRHVGEDVARHALERGIELGGEARDCAVVFVDLVGSTELAANRPPAQVVAMLNRFFAQVVEAVRPHGGWVNKFEGDAALCVFGAPNDQPDAAGSALAPARDLANRLRREVPELRAGIGVSAGQAVAGNVGASERFEYTVIGDPVNEAARLADIAKTTPGGVLASDSVLAAADRSEAEHWRQDGEVVLRGRARPTRLARPEAPTA
jgi:adenylate cyclase